MTAIDPVCGTVADIEEAVGEDHHRWANFSCSERCHGLHHASLEQFSGRERAIRVPSTKTTERDDHGQG